MANSTNNADDNFEVISVDELRNGDWLKKALGDLSKASAAKQITVGGITGWFSGYLCAKVGKVAATAVGGSLLVLQVAQHYGYVKINWKKLEKELNEKAQTAGSANAKRKYSDYAQQVMLFAQQNVCLAGGFAGGFLIGLAS